MPKVAVTNQTSYTVLPPEVYKAEIKELQVKKIIWDNIEKDVLEFTFVVIDDEEFEGVEVKGIATLLERLSPKSKLRQWAEAILNRKLDEGEELDTDQLIGRTCRISTTTKEGKQGGTFTAIKDLLPARQPRNKSNGGGDSGEDRY